MTRAPAALALLAMLSANRTLGAEPCAPRADLTGDAAAIARVAAELQRLGDATGAAVAGCSSVRARVHDDASGGIAVAVVDGARTQALVVSDAVLAAAWIDSWLRDGVGNAPAGTSAPAGTNAPPGTNALTKTNELAGTDAPAAPAKPNAPAATPKRVADASADPADREPPRATHRAPTLLDRISFAADYASAWSSGGDAWTGLDAAACVRVGPLCLGARARYATQTPTATLTAGTRSDLSALATASVPLDLGRMSISPELGLGLGRMSTVRRDAACTPSQSMCDPTTDPMCMPNSAGDLTCFDAAGNFYVGDKLHATTTTPRISAALRVAVPLFEHVSLDAVASFTYAPLGHGDAYTTPTDLPSGTMPPTTSLAGEPSTVFQLGVGLRVGAP